ncbi:MAG TPA: 2Fe-2S iron-sulfur cluster-binding protein [Gemmatimonadales bacterium]|nr:2Fe-2S iron-sulfur cluster-binding protein [Gemmatimonadales bacterium]
MATTGQGTSAGTGTAGAAAAPPPQDLVSCTINGVAVSVPKGTRIIEAAEAAGIGIPYYCYHPGLSAPAMCRMCLVEVEGVPKLQPACVTPVGDGQKIVTESAKAREAREGNLEFYLLNHPLDCPICDKAGECKLQDYAHAEGRKHGRVIEPKRVLNQDDFGGDVLYEGDRCILCTRCVRFMREIAGNDALCVVQRGSRSVIDTFFEEGVDGDLWAGNIIDICPVGALLSKDFLHKARAWDLDRSPSICPNCSQGCNVYVDSRDNLIMRLRPRANPEVNSYWMCEEGRLEYEWYNRANVPTGTVGMADTIGGGPNPTGRCEQPMVRDAQGRLHSATWQDAAIALVERLGGLQGENGVLAVASPAHSNEDVALLHRLAQVLGGGDAVFRVRTAPSDVVCPGFPKLARRRELAANGRGLRAVGFRRVGDDAGTGGLDDLTTAGKIVIVLGDALTDLPDTFGADAALFVYLGSEPGPAVRNAGFILPVTNFVEQEGTFTNFEGRVQRFWPALEPPPLARPAWQLLGVLLAGLDDAPAPANAASAFLRVAELYDAFGGLSYEAVGGRGALLNEPVRLGAGAAEEA